MQYLSHRQATHYTDQHGMRGAVHAPVCAREVHQGKQSAIRIKGATPVKLVMQTLQATHKQNGIVVTQQGVCLFLQVQPVCTIVFLITTLGLGQVVQVYAHDFVGCERRWHVDVAIGDLALADCYSTREAAERARAGK